MCRPVAMTSNLHNVLFVPEDGVLYVANADHHRCPSPSARHVRLDLRELLAELSGTPAETSGRFPQSGVQKKATR